MPASRLDDMDFDNSNSKPDSQFTKAPDTRTTVPIQPAEPSYVPPKVAEDGVTSLPSESTAPPFSMGAKTPNALDKLTPEYLAKNKQSDFTFGEYNTVPKSTIDPNNKDAADALGKSAGLTDESLVGTSFDKTEKEKIKLGPAAEIPNYSITPNMLHDYATYTYSLSLHALSPEDYSIIMDNPSEDFVPKAVLIASAGRYNVERHDEFKYVDFFFDNLEIETVIGLGQANKNTNAISTSFTIIEPYGVTLLNRIMNVCSSIGGENFREMPYLLQIDFFGSKDDGIPMKIPGITKMIPIRFNEFKIKLSTKGAEYAITATPFNHTAYSETIASTPTKLEVIAATVGDFFLAKPNKPAEVDPKDTQAVQDRQYKQQQLDLANRLAATENAKRQEDPTTRKLSDKSQTQLKAEQDIEVLKKEVDAALAVHSYTGAVNAWHRALKDNGKVQLNHIIEFEICDEIANAAFPAEQYLPPAYAPMATTKRDADTTVTENVKQGVTPAAPAAPKDAKNVAAPLPNTANAKYATITRPGSSVNYNQNVDPYAVPDPATANPVMVNRGSAKDFTARQQENIVEAAASTNKNKNNQNGLYTKIYAGNTQTRIMALNQGTSIMEVISLAIRSSSFITSQLNTPFDYNVSVQTLADQNKKNLTWFRITPRIKILGYDYVQRTFAKQITYKISTYEVYNTQSLVAPQGEPQGFVKEYQYMYTGNNNDVINLDINFDTLYYVAQTTAVANTAATSAPKMEIIIDENGKYIEQQKIATNKEGQDSKTSPANQGLQPTFSNINTQTGSANLTDRSAVAAGVEKAILTSPSGDMLSINLKIVGDPDFIKQDDCFYSNRTLQANKDANFKLPNGSIVMDLGEIFVNVVFKTPGDYNEEGLARPGYEKYNSSIFSGRYRVLKVKNSFKGGKFEQELELIRYPNQPTQGVDKVVKPTANDQRDTASTPAGERSDGTLSPETLNNGKQPQEINSGNPMSDETMNNGKNPQEINWGESENFAESVMKKATALREQIASFPTFALGGLQLNDQVAAAVNSMSAAESGFEDSLIKATAGFQAKLPSMPGMSGMPTMPQMPAMGQMPQLSSSLSSAQSASATATSGVPIAPSSTEAVNATPSSSPIASNKLQKPSAVDYENSWPGKDFGDPKPAGWTG